MKEKLNHLLEEGRERIAAVKSETELQEIKAVLLGKQGFADAAAQGAAEARRGHPPRDGQGRQPREGAAD